MALSDEQALQEQTADLVAYPREEMGVDCKAWVDLGHNSERAKISKDLMALANHGGGFLVFGIGEADDGQLFHSGECPFDLKFYAQDSINGIVKRYASPAFECRVLHEPCPVGCGADHIVVKVPGEHRVPIRCRAGGPDNAEPKQGAVYIRRPKPESAPIEEPHEWDDLFGRCIQARQDELIKGFMTVVGAIGIEGLTEALGTVSGASAPGPRKKVDEFRRTSTHRLDELVAQHGLQQLYEPGVWSVSYAVLPSPGPVPLPRLAEMLTEAAGSETGWPPWWVPTREGIVPYVVEDLIECWLAEPDAPPPEPEDWLRAARGPKDGAHADFWRASASGNLFLARGYQEDGRQGSVPGEHLDVTTVPIWRLAECLLHAQRFALEYGGSDSTVAFSVRWEGLAGRTLISVNERREVSPRRCNQDVVESYGEFSAAGMRGRLAEVVQQLARPLYAAFEFFDPPLSLYEEELARMLDR